jgi:hypothetical protein
VFDKTGGVNGRKERMMEEWNDGMVEEWNDGKME